MMGLSKKNLKYKIVKFKLMKDYPFICPTLLSNAPVFYLFFVACGTNMGDHAIVKAETEFIRKIIGERASLIEILVRQSESAIRVLRKYIRKQDVIVLSGGGYLGDEYIETYAPICNILKYFSQNQILIFPQTVFFHSKKNERYFMKLCKRCKNLDIYLREESSKAIFNQYDITTEVVPDIVLTITPMQHLQYNGNILLCLRNDVEKALTPEQEGFIYDTINKFGKVVVTDTVYPHIFPLREKNRILQEMWKGFGSCSLVITDRMHGMVFSYITNTPCIAIGNYNHKVESEYKWLEKSENIVFVKDLSTLTKVIPVLYEKKSDNEGFIHEFDCVAEKVKKCCE